MSDNDAVRLTVFRLNPDEALPTVGALSATDNDRLIHQVDVTTDRLLTAASAVVREFVPPDRIEQLLAALGTSFAIAPTSGFAAVVNVPTRLVFVAVWPWAKGSGRLAPKAAR